MSNSFALVLCESSGTSDLRNRVVGVSSRRAAPANERCAASAFSSGKAAPPDGAHPFEKGVVATEKTKKPEPVVKPIRA